VDKLVVKHRWRDDTEDATNRDKVNAKNRVYRDQEVVLYVEEKSDRET